MKRFFSVVVAAALAAALCVGAFAEDSVGYTPYPQVEFQYTQTVVPGTIRYASQNPNGRYFYDAYWNSDAELARHQCLAACLSMALSYVGVEATPGYILSQNNNYAKPNNNWGGSTCLYPAFDAAWSSYVNGDGTYSPPIIHLSSYSSGGHYVLVIAKVSDTVYKVADPYNSELWDITISGGNASYDYYGTPKTDYIDGSIQYYLNNGGIPTSPEPVAESTVLKFNINSSIYTKNGEERTTDVAPYIKNDRTYLPAGIVCLELGAGVSWDQDTQSVTITKGSTVLKMTINSTAVTLNGRAETLATAPELKNDRTCLPITYVARALGAEVSWEGETETVTITLP